MSENIEHDNRSIRRITYIGMVGNILLAIVKTGVGLTAGSIALVADGIHSLSDSVTDVAVIFGVYLGSRKPDIDHPYGHGRLETFSTAFVAIVLVLVGGGMIYKASINIARMRTDEICVIGSVVIWIALISVVLKEVLYQYTKKVAVKTGSSALYANAWHHRSDAFSSIAVIVGAITVKMGYPYGDQLAAIVVGLMIILVGVKVFTGCLHEFAERAVDDQTVAQITKVLESEERIQHWHRLRTRTLGREIFIDLHILVDPELNVTQAHEIADTFERDLQQQMTRPINVMVHIEPDTPKMRQERD